MANPGDYSGDAGYSPAAGTYGTDQVYGAPGPAPNPNQEEFATETDTTGTSAAGIGAALPGGSLQDTAPTYGGYGAAGPETGKPGSEYAVTETGPGAYGWSPGSPDTEGVYGGGTPANFVPTNTGLVGTLDTTVGGGGAFYAAYGTPPAYRAPSAYVAAGVKETTLTDILGNQIAAQPLVDASYAANNIDTSYIGAPAAPAPLSTQVDTYQITTAGPAYYATQPGVIPSTLVVKDVTKATTLTLNTNYTVTTAGNGPNTALYITLLASSGYSAGDTISLNYSYGTPQYFDSNLPAAQSITVTDTLYLATNGQQLAQWGVTTSPSALTVFDVTRNANLTYNTDYTVRQVTQAYTPNESWLSPSQVPISYVITRIVNSPNCSNGDIIQVTYAYNSPVPLAPGMGSVTAQTDTVTGFSGTPSALSRTGIVTAPGALVVTDLTSPRAGNVLVLNQDYTLTITGSGSSLTYSVARLSGSTRSSSGDSVSVAYSYGNSAYFASGPVQPANFGVYVPWSPPAGVTEVDYYFVMCSDGGTKYVPATGGPSYYGQPSPSGGADTGNPVYQSDTFTSAFSNNLPAPAAPVPTTSNSGGTVANGVYGVITTYTNAQGESLGSAAGTVTTTGTNVSTLTVPSPAAVPGATGWYAYITQANGAVYTRQQTLGSPTAIGTNLTLTAPPTSSGANPPVAYTAGSTLTKTGIITPPGQLIVRDLTSTERDPMQPTGTVLELGYDYTVNVTGVGPWLTYTISRLPGSVNSAIGDTITVDYWYDLMGTIPLSAANDSITLVASAGALHNTAVITAPQALIVYDSTISKPLAYGLDYTVAQTGEGPDQTYTITVITSGPAGAGTTDTLHVYYLYGQQLGVLFTQGMTENIGPIYTPAGTTRTMLGYRFAVAAGNRAGLGPMSAWSDYTVPLNPNVNSAPTSHQYPGTLDPANTINPIYLPNGTIKAGTGLGA